MLDPEVAIPRANHVISKHIQLWGHGVDKKQVIDKNISKNHF